MYFFQGPKQYRSSQTIYKQHTKNTHFFETSSHNSCYSEIETVLYVSVRRDVKELPFGNEGVMSGWLQ